MQFVDAETKEPLAGARVVIPPASDNATLRTVMLPEDALTEPPRIEGPPGHPPPREYRATTDEKGLASLPTQRTGGPFAVLHEKGVAWLEDIALPGDDTRSPLNCNRGLASRDVC
jgi:hypothetical protein